MVPEKKNENLLPILKNLCAKISAPVTESEVFAVRRVAKMNNESARPRNILVTLPSERHRDYVISAFQRYKKANRTNPLNSSDLGFPAENGQYIYVTEHLAPECKELHSAARKAAKERAYKFVWVKYGRVYMRKNE